MSLIIPAILEETKEKFVATASLVTKIPGVERIQVDFGDGEFIAGKLLQASEVDTLNPAFTWEAHLMCKAPNDFLEYNICGFKVLLVHYEAYASVNDLKSALEEIKKLGMKAGVVINPDTKVNVLKDIVADQYLIMSVVPGKQGQSFIPETLERIKELRSLLPSAIIEIDGGVNETNIKSIKEAGADLIVAGSAVVRAENPSAAFEKLKSS